MTYNLDKTEVQTITFSIELVMYGTVMARLDRCDEGVQIQYAAIADGGDVCGQSVEVFAGKSLDSFVEKFNSLTFHDEGDEKDEDATRGWGIQIEGKDANTLAMVKFGYWEETPICELVECIRDTIADCEATDALWNILTY